MSCLLYPQHRPAFARFAKMRAKSSICIPHDNVYCLADISVDAHSQQASQSRRQIRCFQSSSSVSTTVLTFRHVLSVWEVSFHLPKNNHSFFFLAAISCHNKFNEAILLRKLLPKTTLPWPASGILRVCNSFL